MDRDNGDHRVHRGHHSIVGVIGLMPRTLTTNIGKQFNANTAEMREMKTDLSSRVTGVTLTLLLLLPVATDGQDWFEQQLQKLEGNGREANPDELSTAGEFRCSFPDMGIDLAVTEVNFEETNRFGSAKVIGNLGSANVTAVNHFMWHSLSFIEITFGGQANMLTVYAQSRPGGMLDSGFEAVYTRHAADFEGGPLAQHEEGVCRIAGWRTP